MNNLLDILKGCLNSNTIQQAESMLRNYGQKPTFLQELLVLIPNQEPQVLTMILSTLKNYILAHWNPPPQNNTFFIPPNQKKIIMDNILNLYYEISHNDQAVNLYKNIAEMIILVEYPWQGIDQHLCNDLGNGVFASVYFCREIARAYEYTSDENQRKKAEYFASNFYPKFQGLVENCLSNFNDQTSKLMYIIFKTFFSSVHIELPDYFKNQDNFVKWFVYVKTLLNAQLQNNLFNQRICAKILSRIVSQYMNKELDSKKLKGWSENLIARIGEDVTNLILSCLANPNGDQETASHILASVGWLVANQRLRVFLNEQNFQYILYDRLLPNMESSASDLELFQKDPVEYIRKDQDLTSDAFKKNAADTVERLLYYGSYGQKSQLIKFIEYSATSFQSSTVSDRHKEVLVRQLTKMSSTLKKNRFIQEQFQYLVITFFLPMLKVDSPLLNAQVCRFFGAYLDDMKLSEGTVTQLMGLIYGKMIEKYLVLKYNAILAFTSLLSQQSALNSAKQHFQNILQIYVKMLDEMDHENLLKCLERIVSNFSNEIVMYAPNLITHLMNKFNSTYNADATEEDQEQDSNKEASASLSTISQILQCPLSDEVYYQASEQIVPMIKLIFDQLQDYFSEVLTLINVLVHKAKGIAEGENLYVICRKLLEGKDCNIHNNQIDFNISNLMNKITESSDIEYEANLISILKNLIQKLPDNILHKYPYPIHSELILALIENKRLSLNEIGQLNTVMVDGIWAEYLQSYKAIVYGEGSVTSPQNLKTITGVSLYPWLMNYFDVNLVKVMLSQINEDEEEDNLDYYEENTMQMLQKYANEDDDEEACDEYYGTEGVNYSYFYESPYDSSKDREIFVQKLKSLSNEEAAALMNQLNSKNQKTLQSLFN